MAWVLHPQVHQCQSWPLIPHFCPAGNPRHPQNTPAPPPRNIWADGFCATHILLTPAPHRDSSHLILRWECGRWRAGRRAQSITSASQERWESAAIDHLRCVIAAPIMRGSGQAGGGASHSSGAAGDRPSAGVTQLQPWSTNFFQQEFSLLVLMYIKAAQLNHLHITELIIPLTDNDEKKNPRVRHCVPEQSSLWQTAFVILLPITSHYTLQNLSSTKVSI